MKKMTVVCAALAAVLAFTGCSKSNVQINSIADLAGRWNEYCSDKISA